MEDAEVIRRGRDLLRKTKQADNELTNENFLDWAERVADALKALPSKKQSEPWVLPVAAGLRRLRDDFAKVVEMDPPVIYRPQHQACLEFHQSQAKIRYYRAPNRSSKTQSAVIDNYWHLTGQHPYRKVPPQPAATATLVFNFAKNMTGVFVPKYIHGETGNVLSPVFPEGGKYFNHWDERRYILKLGCPACVAAGRPKECRHANRSTMLFFSAQEDTTAFAGGQYGLVHFDEQIPEEFFTEGLQRIKTVRDSGMIVTETPLGGKGFWTHIVLTRDALSKKTVGESKRVLVSLHTCSQYDTGLYPKDEIDADRALMSEQEAEARVFGRPAAYSKTSVFDRFQISEMFDGIRDPQRGQLRIHALDPHAWGDTGKHQEKSNGDNTKQLLSEASDETAVAFIPDEESELRVWEPPQKFHQYVVGADVAEGMTKNDASCAQVLKMERVGTAMRVTHVASWHGWCNSLSYAHELFKLALWYNCALLVPERRGPGDATIQELKDMGCWLLFRDITDPSFAIPGQDPRFGLDTNVKTKPIFISILQNLIWNRRTRVRNFVTYDRETLEELGAYGQERTESGQTVRFRGESGTHDDRVMGTALAAYPAVTSYAYDVSLEQDARKSEHDKHTGLNVQERALWDRLHEDAAARAARERW